MKKYLSFILIGIISFIGINNVSAYSSEAPPLTGTYLASSFYANFDKHIEAYNTYKNNIDHLVDYWKNNHSSEYPYYFIIGDYGQDYFTNEEYFDYTLYSSNSSEFVLERGALRGLGNIFNGTEYFYTYHYDSRKNEYQYSNVLRAFQFSLDGSSYIIDSNVFPTFKTQKYQYTQSLTLYTEDYSSIDLPHFNLESISLSIPLIEINNENTIPTLKSLYDESYISDLTKDYIEIDLNMYSYVILSLKDYTPRDTYTATAYVKGQLCATTVYKYGQEEKKDYISGYQTQNCGYYFNDYTTHMLYIRSEDISHHAIYYLTGYDSSKPNLVKIDTSIFDISYITKDNENNPSVSINGKDYPVLPYSELTDTATLTEIYGISNTWTCAKYDTDCHLNSTGININDLFDKPLQALKSVWTAITSIYNLITEFILLLPPIMQGFLYFSFGITIILGIIKVLL